MGLGSSSVRKNDFSSSKMKIPVQQGRDGTGFFKGFFEKTRPTKAVSKILYKCCLWIFFEQDRAVNDASLSDVQLVCHYSSLFVIIRHYSSLFIIIIYHVSSLSVIVMFWHFEKKKGPTDRWTHPFFRDAKMHLKIKLGYF